MPKSLFDLVTSSSKYVTTGDNIYLKMQPGYHRIRVLPSWRENELPVRLIIQHQNFKDKDNNLRMPLCFNYAYKNEDVALILANEKKVIKPKDIELFNQFACIYCRLGEIISNMYGKKNNNTYPRKRYMLNVLNRDDAKTYIWTVSEKIVRDIATFHGGYPHMFNINDGIDLQVHAEGEKIQRRYQLTPIPERVPLGVEFKPHDLDSAMADGYTNSNETMELLLNSYGSLLPVIPINPADWLSNENPPF